MDKTLISTFAILIAVAAIAPDRAAAQQSYPMMCRGGGGMNASAAANGNVRLAFAWGAGGASASPPGPGECKWLDRGARPGEPNVLAKTGDRATAQYLVQGMLGGGSFYVHVFNNNAGAMVITRTGP